MKYGDAESFVEHSFYSGLVRVEHHVAKRTDRDDGLRSSILYVADLVSRQLERNLFV